MFVNQMVPLVLSAALSSGSSSAPSSTAVASPSCAELAKTQEESEAAAARLAAWMDRHCPGAMEDTDPFCKLQSDGLLQRLDELGELRAALAAKGCALRDSPSAEHERGSRSPVVASSPRPIDHPGTIGSFEDNWPWPRVPTFQAGLAASAAFRIRRCLDDPECEW